MKKCAFRQMLFGAMMMFGQEMTFDQIFLGQNCWIFGPNSWKRSVDQKFNYSTTKADLAFQQIYVDPNHPYIPSSAPVREFLIICMSKLGQFSQIFSALGSSPPHHDDDDHDDWNPAEIPSPLVAADTKQQFMLTHCIATAHCNTLHCNKLYCNTGC